jgi:hypothetical protein
MVRVVCVVDADFLIPGQLKGAVGLWPRYNSLKDRMDTLIAREICIGQIRATDLDLGHGVTPNRSTSCLFKRSMLFQRSQRNRGLIVAMGERVHG